MKSVARSINRAGSPGSDADRSALALIFAICPVPMLLVGEDGCICQTNCELDQLFGYPAGTLIGQPVETLIPTAVATRHAAWREAYFRAPTRRAMGAGLDLFGMTRDGHRLPLELGLAPVELSGTRGVLVTAVDVSARRTVELELDRRAKELESTNSDLRHVARSASHGLKAPLTSICGLLGLALEDMDSGDFGEARRVVADALRLGRRGARLIESVNGLVDGTPAVLERVALKCSVSKAWSRVTAGMELHPELTLDLHEDMDITTDRKLLTMMLEHLLSNACRFQDRDKADRWVRVGSSTDAASIAITVEDNGVGIPIEMQHRVFFAFDRLQKASGDGFGLTQVRRGAERLGGSIDFRSEPGEGSTFTLMLPKEPKT